MPDLLFKLSLLLVVSCMVTSAREVPPSLAAAHSLEERLAGAGLAQCWSALTELRSCKNEMVLFFLNGESYLTIDCCRAIRLITQNCWPAMLASLGFTSQEADILKGYCDAETAAPPAHAPLASNVADLKLIGA